MNLLARLPEDQPEPDNCNCEHVRCGHEYGGVPAGARRAQYVGPICNECADSHMADYMLGERDDDDEACPVCGLLNWGRNPIGQLECVSCRYTLIGAER